MNTWTGYKRAFRRWLADWIHPEGKERREELRRALSNMVEDGDKTDREQGLAVLKYHSQR